MEYKYLYLYDINSSKLQIFRPQKSQMCRKWFLGWGVLYKKKMLFGSCSQYKPFAWRTYRRLKNFCDDGGGAKRFQPVRLEWFRGRHSARTQILHAHIEVKSWKSTGKCIVGVTRRRGWISTWHWLDAWMDCLLRETVGDLHVARQQRSGNNRQLTLIVMNMSEGKRTSMDNICGSVGEASWEY